MIEMAVAYIGAAIGKKLLDHMGDDAGDAFDASLKKLYRWVRARFSGHDAAERSLRMLEKHPAEQDAQLTVAEKLAEAVDGDPAASSELRELLGELDRTRPPGLVIRGTAVVEGDLEGDQAGAKVTGPLPDHSVVGGDATVKGTVREGASNIGVVLDFRDDAATPEMP
jgi:hypothetical protein